VDLHRVPLRESQRCAHIRKDCGRVFFVYAAFHGHPVSAYAFMCRRGHNPAHLSDFSSTAIEHRVAELSKGQELAEEHREFIIEKWHERLG
jgi:hypothetical protein